MTILTVHPIHSKTNSVKILIHEKSDSHLKITIEELMSQVLQLLQLYSIGTGELLLLNRFLKKYLVPVTIHNMPAKPDSCWMFQSTPTFMFEQLNSATTTDKYFKSSFLCSFQV